MLMAYRSVRVQRNFLAIFLFIIFLTKQITTARTGPRAYSLEFLKESSRLIHDFFPDDADKILDHGCWCGYLNDQHENLIHLGGAIELDKLDEICHHWFKARYRTDKHDGGICKKDGKGYKSNDLSERSYLLDIRSRRYDTGCVAEYNDWMMNTRQLTQCEVEDCEIDRRFLLMIYFYITLYPDYASENVKDEKTCLHHLDL